MKRLLIVLSVMLCLTGCSGEDRALEDALGFRDRLLKARGCRFAARITADYGETLMEFAMDCQADAGGDLSFQVTLPESISGIEGTLSGSGGTLTFDRTALQFDLLADGQLSPVSSPWILVKTLRSGYITAACREEDLLHISVDDSYAQDALRLDIWLEEDRPVRGDVLFDGRRILALEVRNFEFL